MTGILKGWFKILPFFICEYLVKNIAPHSAVLKMGNEEFECELLGITNDVFLITRKYKK